MPGAVGNGVGLKYVKFAAPGLVGAVGAVYVDDMGDDRLVSMATNDGGDERVTTVGAAGKLALLSTNCQIRPFNAAPRTTICSNSFGNIVPDTKDPVAASDISFTISK